MVKIDSAEQTWKSPDGQRVLFRVVTSEGKAYKTFSKTIGKEGWTGEVEEYEKNGEKFIKQPDTGGAYRGGGTKSFKADPVKLNQDLKLEIARNQSIQRQVALKAAVDLTIAGMKENGSNPGAVDRYFEHFMKLLNPKLKGEEDENGQSAD